MAEPAASDRLPGGIQRVRRATFVVLLVLLIQYQLGMATNLFVTIPKHHPGAGPAITLRALCAAWAGRCMPRPPSSWRTPRSGSSSSWPHAALGIVLVLAAIGLVVQAARLPRRGLIAATTLGALFIIGACFNGVSFLDYNQSLSSFIWRRSSPWRRSVTS